MRAWILVLLIIFSLGCVQDTQESLPGGELKTMELCGIEREVMGLDIAGEHCYVDKSGKYGYGLLTYSTKGDSFKATLSASGLNPNSEYKYSLQGPELAMRPDEEWKYSQLEHVSSSGTRLFCKSYRENMGLRDIGVVITDSEGKFNVTIDYKGTGDCVLEGEYTEIEFRVVQSGNINASDNTKRWLLNTEPLSFEITEGHVEKSVSIQEEPIPPKPSTEDSEDAWSFKASIIDVEIPTSNIKSVESESVQTIMVSYHTKYNITRKDGSYLCNYIYEECDGLCKNYKNNTVNLDNEILESWIVNLTDDLKSNYTIFDKECPEGLKLKRDIVHDHVDRSHYHSTISYKDGSSITFTRDGEMIINSSRGTSVYCISDKSADPNNATKFISMRNMAYVKSTPKLCWKDY